MITNSGLQYIETETGGGKMPKRGQTVSVHYIGRLEDGKEFDNSVKRGQPIEFSLGVGQVISGWDEGIGLMKVGGKATLIIPPNLGYGSSGAGGVIPPNATLIFDVELVDVT
ncbi:MAG: FKBP-type peptidyl-prolyl cis-trans isomerase [Chloroflexi bacterium]|nr:FKBP-type peptidyl-prolyl cis-trans isomerase [Chloroflexota bacterium]